MDEQIPEEEWDKVPFSKEDRDNIVSQLRGLDCDKDMKNAMYLSWKALVKKKRWELSQKEERYE